MHASIIQLLSLRDGEPVAAVIAEHVDSCKRCAAEVARLEDLRERMQVLPSPTLADTRGMDSLWARIQPSLAAADRPPSATNWYLAVAAAIVWTVVAVVWFGIADNEPSASPRTVAITALAPSAVDNLLLESQDLESALLDLPRRPHIEQAATAATLDALEGRIQWLDYTLSRANEDGIPGDQAADLWQERVDLLESLVTLRYAQASRMAF